MGGFRLAALRRLLLPAGLPRFGALDALFFCDAPPSYVRLHRRYNREMGHRLRGGAPADQFAARLSSSRRWGPI